MSGRARISRIEELVSSALEVQAEKRRRLAKVLPTYARRHATAVADPNKLKQLSSSFKSSLGSKRHPQNLLKYLARRQRGYCSLRE